MSTTPTVPTSPGPFAILLKYLNIFRASLVERLAYRGDFLLGTILRFLPVLTTVLLWTAVYEGRAKDTGVSIDRVVLGAQSQAEDGSRSGAFSYREMIAYLLLIHVSRMFSSMPGLASTITRDIRGGELKKYLLQPLDLIAHLLAYRAAHKTAYIATAVLPYGLLFLTCYSCFDLPPDWLTFLGYLGSLLLAFLLGFFFETCLGMAGFWLLEVSSLLWVVGTITYFISGQMFPLDLLPAFWRDLLKALPFQYLAYFPVVVFQGKVTGWELVHGLVMQVVWVAALAVLAKWLYHRGLRRYSAYGG